MLNMSNYQNICHQVKRLTLNEQLNLLEELAAIIRSRMVIKPKRSIMELEGLGKEVWHGLDIQEYLNQERDSWNG
jgi:hypothetical protein